MQIKSGTVTGRKGKKQNPTIAVSEKCIKISGLTTRMSGCRDNPVYPTSLQPKTITSFDILHKIDRVKQKLDYKALSD